jgi:hypothetical protein
MKIVELPAGKCIQLRTSIKELPINRFADCQKYLIQAAGIGSTMADVDSHMNRIYALLDHDLKTEAAQQMQNMHFNMHLMINKIDIDSLAFACLVDSLGYTEKVKNKKGVKEAKTVFEKWGDYSEAGLVKLCQVMGEMGLERRHVLEELSELKKKSILP